MVTGILVKGKVLWEEYEHAEYGIVRVGYKEIDGPDGPMRLPCAVEFDLFTPDSERAWLTRSLEDVILDVHSSVSAFDRTGETDGASGD